MEGRDTDALLGAAGQYYATHDGEWEFSQMFGEEDDSNGGDGSESGGEGTGTPLPLPLGPSCPRRQLD